MESFGQTLKSKRSQQNISLEQASKALLIKKEHLEALENQNWLGLPEKPFVAGFIKNYCEYLGLDTNYLLALYRREFDEAKYPKQKSPLIGKAGLGLTPNKVSAITFTLAIFIFIFYLGNQYLSILSAPSLEITSPQDESTSSTAAIVLTGKTEKDAQVSVNGEFTAVDSEGNFSYQIKLTEGKNIIEVNATKRLSPKAKVTRVVRLTN